ncbi:hypothetical protein [uncultured Microbacterium sp.]|uniref:hypothetical protein n=1 Tax=uncultured Microbacterium sp. TaxID=191216 RepID=UPI0028D05DD3|nr:hypothetical protein [uncultured Microbacterium sp.]
MIRRVLIGGGLALFAVSAIVLVSITGLLNEPQSSAPAPTGSDPFNVLPTDAPPALVDPGGEGSLGAPEVDTARNAIEFLRAYEEVHPDADLTWVEDLIDEQRDQIKYMALRLEADQDEIADLEAQINDRGRLVMDSTAPPPADPSASVGIVVSITGAITGAVAAVAGVLSAMAAFGQRRSKSGSGAPPAAVS